MLKTGLCFSYDPTIRDIQNVKKIQLSPSGLQHLHWGSWDETYIGTMLSVTPIGNEAIFEKLKSYDNVEGRTRWTLEIIAFLEYLIDEDDVHTLNIDHTAYEGQRKIKQSLKIKLTRMSTRLHKLTSDSTGHS